MGIPIIGDIINAVKDIVSEVVVDKDKKNELNVRLQELSDKADARVHEQVLAQIAVNNTEAASSSMFVAGWRPFIGWVSGGGVAYSIIIQPFASWVARLANYTGDFPAVDTTVLLYVLGGMLGISGMRTIEKIKDVATNVITPKKEEAPAPTDAPAPTKRKRFKL